MKTLGQIAYEAWHGYAPTPEDWPECDKMVIKWESVARAVALECAKVCESQAVEPECPERAQYCADAIRMRSNVKWTNLA